MQLKLQAIRQLAAYVQKCRHALPATGQEQKKIGYLHRQATQLQLPVACHNPAFCLCCPNQHLQGEKGHKEYGDNAYSHLKACMLMALIQRLQDNYAVYSDAYQQTQKAHSAVQDRQKGCQDYLLPIAVVAHCNS